MLNNITPLDNPNPSVLVNTKQPQTWVPLSLTPEEYKKKGLEVEIDPYDQKRFEFVNKCQGNYTRTVSSIRKVRTDDDKLWLDWDEVREGKTGMGKKLDPIHISSVGKKKIPVPKEETVFNEETESYEVKIVSTRETIDEFWLPFSLEALEELLKDANPYRLEKIIKHDNGDVYSATVDELRDKDFNKVFNLKVQARSGHKKQ